MSTLPSISEHIDEKIINKVIQNNFAALAPSYFTLTSNWFVRAYDHWKDIDKFVIVIYLIHQDLIYFRQNGLKINYETFYEKKSIEIDKINISDISKDLGVPKESIRRKVLELQKIGTIKRIGKKVIEKNGIPLDGPVSGGCHRAATGNIAIFVGGERKAFDRILSALTVMGRKVLHTGELGSATVLKVITNYLASVHLVALGEAWTVAKKSNLDLAKAYKGIAVSSGNSFVHETESQVILNGSYNINFTMDLVLKDTGLFDDLAKKLNAGLEISPKIVDIFKDGQKKYGSRAWSSMIVKRMEDINNINFRADGFPEELTDNEPEEKGYEI